MLRIYISHAAADKAHLDRFLTWLKPLEEKYFLRVWHDRPLPKPKPWPFPGNIVYGRRKSPNPPPTHHPDLDKRLADAHVFIFLVSHKSLATAHIEGKEIPTAVGRYVTEGTRFLKIVPVPITESHWKDFSRLSGFPAWPLGFFDKNRKSIAVNQYPKFDRIKHYVYIPGAGWPDLNAREDETAWHLLTLQLDALFAETRKDLHDEAVKNGQPTDDFFQKEKAAPPPEPDFRETAFGIAFAWLVVFSFFYAFFQVAGFLQELRLSGVRVAEF